MTNTYDNIDFDHLNSLLQMSREIGEEIAMKMYLQQEMEALGEFDYWNNVQKQISQLDSQQGLLLKDIFKLEEKLGLVENHIF